MRTANLIRIIKDDRGSLVKIVKDGTSPGSVSGLVVRSRLPDAYRILASVRHSVLSCMISSRSIPMR
jgi:hypothetical protein